MRKQTENDLKKVRNAEDMLKGCINRMCITEDMQEFANLYHGAIYHIGKIFDVNYDRLTAKSEE